MEYENITPALAGMKDGLGGKVESWVASTEVAFGAPVWGYVGDEKIAGASVKDSAVLTFSGDLITGNKVVVTVNGKAATEVTFDTSHAATMAALAEAIELLDLPSIEAEVDGSDDKKLNLRTKGAAIEASAKVTEGVSQATATAATSSSQVFLGVALRTAKEGEKYTEGEAMNVMTHGRLWAKVTGSVQANTTAYINAGLDGFAASGTAINGRFKSNGEDLAILEVNGI